MSLPNETINHDSCNPQFRDSHFPLQLQKLLFCTSPLLLNLPVKTRKVYSLSKSWNSHLFAKEKLTIPTTLAQSHIIIY